MLDAIAENLAEVIQSSIWLAPLAALVGGLLTAANPCVLAAAPLMVGYVAGQEKRTVGRSFLLSVTFALGLTITFGLLWFGVWSASSLLSLTTWKYVAVGVCLLMGLHLLGILRFALPVPSGLLSGAPHCPRCDYNLTGLTETRCPECGEQFDWETVPHRGAVQRGFLGALLLGLLFGLISMPCAGPVLMALIVVTPLYGTAFGVLLLVAYSLGHCGLVLVGGTSIGLVQKLADSKGWTRGTAILRRIAGLLIMGVGVWLLIG
jgi:cytochrome c-type biogenesis protein